ncbi:heat shock protein 90 [Reticulomyxa filosa]|uniref:Heat shock protein 90 n=1 Tax=Reticulomyxa filosa TaxID=46433 RepID=X6LD58_RETFI|nr:heat shock protein 90 [Reticulomyxa filosa]|eukprot:ETN99061.1 heat shock protein 90 [Reticulomyxa filosa]
MTNAVYSSELISNESNALDKVRYVSPTNPEVFDKDKKFKIEVLPDPDEKLLLIRYTGIGMMKVNVVNNLGTIAIIGTKQLIEDQFVGFYSAYLMSERVVVISDNDDDEQHLCESTASGTFRVCVDGDNPYKIKRETEINLNLDNCANFCKGKTIKEIIKKLSQFIAFPVNLLTIKEKEKVYVFVFYPFLIYVHTVGGKCFYFFFLRQEKNFFLFRKQEIPNDEMTCLKVVLFLANTIDEYNANQLREYAEKKLIRKIKEKEKLTEKNKKRSWHKGKKKSSEAVEWLTRRVHLLWANMERIMKAFQALMALSIFFYCKGDKTICRSFLFPEFCFFLIFNLIFERKLAPSSSSQQSILYFILCKNS